jgi:xylan 1,4-beta-xylosidase
MYKVIRFKIYLIIGINFLVYSQCLSQKTTIVNPVLKGFYPDPSIVKAGTDYYLVNSTFSYFPGLPIMQSKDLKNWKQIGNVIHSPSQLDFMGERITRGLFAPGINYHKGIFYVTCTDIDHDGNFVVTATNPAGPWSQPIKIPQVRGIDPCIHFDEETDKAYIIYNSDAPDRKPLYSGHRTIRMYEFDYKNLKVVGDEKILVNGGVDISKKPVWIEGPHFLKRNGFYYLYAAEGGTSVNHSQVVLRSESVWGPYIPYEKNPILTQRDLPADRPNPITSAGHAHFVVGPDGKDYAVFLAVRPYEGDFYNTGRETFLAPVEWKDGWPIINPGQELIPFQFTVNYKEVKQKNALPQSGNFKYTIPLKKGLDPTFLFLRTLEEGWHFIDKKKGLVINLRPETIMEFKHPAFIGKRQQHINSLGETEMSFVAKSENEKAGLIILQDEKHFYYVAKSLNANGNQVVQLLKSKTEGNTMETLTEVVLPQDNEKIHIKIQSQGEYYHFHYSLNGKKWILLKDKVDGKFLSTKVAGGFTGCLYGMYATSNGTNSDNKATFKHLKYAGNDPTYK